VALFFPPVGGGILLGAAVTGGAYLVGKLAVSAFQVVKNWIKTDSSKEPLNAVEQLGEGNISTPQNTPAPASLQDSYTNMQVQLNSEHNEHSITPNPIPTSSSPSTASENNFKEIYMELFSKNSKKEEENKMENQPAPKHF
jgi:hypothetical protein